MFLPRVIPVLQLMGKGLVKTVKFKTPKYIGDPINAVRIFNDLEVDELIINDISATRNKTSFSIDLVKDIGDEAFMPFAVGGGIRTVQSAVDLINSGAEKVVINSLLVENPKIFLDISNTLGSQSVVASIDINRTLFGNYRMYINSGTVKTKYDPVMAAKKAEDYGAGEIILNYIDNDGLMTGYNTELIHKVSSCVKIPVVASCGAGSLLHMQDAIAAGAHSIAASSFFIFHGPRKAVLMNYPTKNDLISIFKNNYNA